MVEISIVLPAYNESHGIGTSLKRLSDHFDAGQQSWEIVVVDDGSEDDTYRIAVGIASGDERITVTRHEVNRGKGAAVRTGALLAHGRLMLVTDVDLSYGLEDLDTAAALLQKSTGPDMVSGDRRHPESRMDLALSALGHVLRRQALSAAFNLTVRLFYRLPWRDTQCGLKGFKREAVLRILARVRTAGFLADIEMFLIAERLGLRIERIPVHLTYLSTDSTVSVLRQLGTVLRDAWTIKQAQMRDAYADPD